MKFFFWAFAVILFFSNDVLCRNKGLQQCGNTCYMNASLQMLSHISELKAFLEQHKDNYLTQSIPLKFLNVLNQLPYDDHRPDAQVFHPQEFHDAAIAAFFKTLGGPQDADEFMVKLCGLIQIQTNIFDVTYEFIEHNFVGELFKRNLNHGVESFNVVGINEFKNEAINFFYARNFNNIYISDYLKEFFIQSPGFTERKKLDFNLLNGLLLNSAVREEFKKAKEIDIDWQSIFYVGTKKDKTYKFEAPPLTVPSVVGTRKISNIHNSFDEAFKGGVKIVSLPQYVLIKIDRGGNQSGGKRYGHAVSFPFRIDNAFLESYISDELKALDLSYDLISIVFAPSGHYLACAKDGRGDWYLYDDSSVSSLSEGVVRGIGLTGENSGRPPYILMYKLSQDKFTAWRAFKEKEKLMTMLRFSTNNIKFQIGAIKEFVADIKSKIKKLRT